MKRKTKTQEKTLTLSVGNVTEAGIKFLGKVIKTADDVKRSKLTITLAKE